MSVLALVTDAFGGRGGIAQYNRDFVSAVATLDTISAVDLLPRICPDPPGEQGGKIRQLPLHPGRAAFSAAAVLQCVRQRYDIVYCGHLYLGPLARILARTMGSRLLSQLHGTEIWEAPTKWRRDALEASDLVFCVSRDTRARALAHSSLRPERVVVQPNTVGERYVPRNRAAARARFGFGDEKILLTVGRLDERDGYKGHDRVIATLPDLVARDPSIVYAIAGEGNDRPRLEALVREKGLGAHVRFLGFLPFADLPDVYSAADVFVMPSTGEGFGIVYLEAMACGTPAIGLPVGGAPDALCDGELGYVSPEDRLPQTIREALDATVDREELSRQVHRRFGWPTFRDHLAAIFEGPLASAPSHREQAA
jgi:phosphatidylinositol alpha-1,6-mannosyltransferase